MHRILILWAVVLVSLISIAPAMGAQPPISPDTEACIECHLVYHPGIIADWQRSRHANTTVQEALTVQGLAKKVSSGQVPEALRTTSVGCAECHGMRGDAHADTFEHNGYDIHVVVSPDDCATCHAEERKQYKDNIMAMAHTNLADNTLYNDLERTILGKMAVKAGRLAIEPADASTRAEACYYCHGTRLTLAGTEVRDTDVGELSFPIITGWPNQGVGRINLDGSRGACSSCHTRHQFSIETARKPDTCSECHAGPDVPAYKVYKVSKHGNLYSSHSSGWDFKPVPWTVGKDFSAPTCAACHVSLVVDENGEVVSERTHTMNDRLGWRLFGLIYAHHQPKSADTAPIRNKSGLPLPTDLDGTPADTFLIGADEVEARRATMQRTCLACHGTTWVNGHFARLDHTLGVTNSQVRTATQLLETIWQKGYAQGPAKGGSPFDEAIERRWCDTWLFYANTIRFNSAMAGGGDYGVFDDGRYPLSSAIMEIHDWLKLRDMAEKAK
ncbi:multiheme c-type cytochrome [Desulfatitalea tepidiphila]|uniref:multiheme c-type cytochrome n=1 Tax=Desulfatitalea tepidiphila TaxID=1185843 RepID=UPI0006B4617F|nr:multiheme c-type cytochrome [Desulfatitalea tepidiphila]